MTTAATLLYSSPAFVCSTAARRDALRVLLPSHALAGGVAIHTLNHAHMLAKDASADKQKTHRFGADQPCVIISVV